MRSGKLRGASPARKQGGPALRWWGGYATFLQEAPVAPIDQAKAVIPCLASAVIGSPIGHPRVGGWNTSFWLMRKSVALIGPKASSSLDSSAIWP
jgi:hypothetical protein